ncbi:MAG: hypothetical protein II779_10525 [Clostridia bacterium]|nr:hypothetical protein [Clostridia bacterium]
MKRIHSRTVLCFALALILGLSGLSGCRREDENRAEAENPHAMSVSLREGTAVGTSDVPAETDAPTEKADPEAEADAPVEADLPPETEAKTEDPPAPDMPAEPPAKTAGTGNREIAVFALEHGERFVCPYGDRIWAVGEDGLTVYDPGEGGLSCTVLAAFSEDGGPLFPDFDSFPVGRLCVDREGIALFCIDRLRLFSPEGGFLSEIPLPGLTPEEGYEGRYLNAALFRAGGLYYVWCRFASVPENGEGETVPESRPVFLQIEAESGKVRELPVSGEDVKTVFSLMADGKNSLALAVEAQIPGVIGVVHGTVSYDLKKEKFTGLFDWGPRSAGGMGMQFDPASGFSNGGGAVRGILEDDEVFRLTRWRTGERDEETLRRISRDPVESRAAELTGEEGRLTVSQFFWTGIDCLFYDAFRSVLVSLSPEPDPFSTLTILYPDVSSNRETNGLRIFDNPIANRLDYAVSLFCAEGGEDGRDVRTVRIPKQEFNLRLRMEMLAGDADFDIVYAQDGRDLLDPILRNGLYLPLETDPVIEENFRSNYLGGIAEIMSDGGHIWGVPFRLSAPALLVDASLFDSPSEAERIRREGWTAAEYWSFCDRVGRPVTNIAAEMLAGLMEDGLREGSVDMTAVGEILSEMLKRADGGTLWNDSRPTPVTSVSVPAADPDPNGLYDENPSIEGRELLPLPGSGYADVSSYIFAYGGTRRPELSLAFMRLLTGRYWVTMFEDGRTCMAAEDGAYHRYTPGLSTLYPASDDPVSIGKKAEELNRAAPEILSRTLAGRSAVRDRESWLALCGIVDRVWNGTVTPEEGAGEFLEKFGAWLYE